MFDDLKLDLKFIFRFILIIISILAIIFTFINNRYAFIYLSTYNSLLTLPIYIVVFILTAKKLFKNDDYQTVILNMIYFTLVILNIITFILGLFFMENKFYMKEFYSIDNIFSIIILPILVMFDYAFFVDKGLYKMYFVPISVIPFVLYLIIVIIRSLIARGNNQILSIYWQEYYPYVFLNFDNVATYLIIISLLCLLFGIASISFGAYFAKCKRYEIEKSED